MADADAVLAAGPIDAGVMRLPDVADDDAAPCS